MLDPHELLPVAYRAAVRVLRSPLLAEEASERAVHQLTLALLGGTPPEHPKAWLRAVARRSAVALLRSGWGRSQSAPDVEAFALQAPSAPPNPLRTESVRARVESVLTPRQRDAFAAALSANSNHAAARRCGMQPRDFRRQLGAISRRVRSLVAEPQPDYCGGRDPLRDLRPE